MGGLSAGSYTGALATGIVGGEPVAHRDTALSAAAWAPGPSTACGWGTWLPPRSPSSVSRRSSRSLRQLELGDDLALHAERAPLSLLAVGVALIAVPTAVTGPVAFIALAAPHIARALTRAPGPPLTAAAATGAFLLLGADFAAQRIVAPTQLPVGAVTTAIGGLYLLAWQTRQR